MDCPRCGHAVSTGAHRCEGCHFELSAVVSVLGLDLVQLDRITDAAHCLRLREAQQVDAFLEDFERRFPQVFVAVYIGVLPQSLSLKELSFWLLNHAAFNIREAKKLNEHAVALIIDPVAKRVGLNVGYALEVYLTTRRLEKVLQAMRTPLWHGEYVGAIEIAVRRIEKYLRKSAARVPERRLAAPETAEAFLGGSGLRPLRRKRSQTQSTKADWDREDESVFTKNKSITS